MNYIKHLTGFFDRVAKDKLLNPTHVSLYMSLFQFWNCNRFRNPISISRDEIMRISKISSKATYHKCLKALHSQGYIKYEPSYNPFKGSHVFLFNFSDDLKPLPKSASSNFKPVIEQVVNKSCTSDETSSEQVNEQVVVPYINNTNNSNDLNNSNSLNLGEQSKKIEEDVIARNEAILSTEAEEDKEKKLREKKKEFIVTSSAVEKPTIENVKSYFQKNNFPELEAQKFFNYFSSIGWLVGGKTPMVDWQATAQNWILNAPKFITNAEPNRPKQLNTTTEKDYSEPL
ncbi:transcriptional regulator [Flavobacterium solisilvae]|uniref:Transcriptional regulator n=1 Tax=Flavobacterium solisilvae TaxID=1852019 RepID=A0ABX1QS02_9FLAO|nr:transcriptional regulator [Flavobacterium solisilvae]NMH24250.1 transcriptional regulator [Flavobacterium solisilvae]